MRTVWVGDGGIEGKTFEKHGKGVKEERWWAIRGRVGIRRE